MNFSEAVAIAAGSLWAKRCKFARERVQLDFGDNVDILDLGGLLRVAFFALDSDMPFHHFLLDFLGGGSGIPH